MKWREQIHLFHRLHFRLALFVITTVVVIFGLSAAYQILVSQRVLTEQKIESSEELCATLTSSLEVAMLNRNASAIEYSFTEIARNENIIRVFLLNTEGEVMVSSEESMVGTRMDKMDEGCHDCHEPGADYWLSTAIELHEGPILRVVAPIENKPQCHSCHAETVRLNGLLVLDRSLVPIRAAVYDNLKFAIVIAGAFVLLMMLAFRWYIKRRVINRVVYLESLARRVVNNELDLDIELRGKDELASLAQSFDNMKRSLKLSIERIEGHRNYLTNLFENMIDGIMILDATNRVAFVNKAFHDILDLDDTAACQDQRADFNTTPLNRYACIGAMIERAQAAERPIAEVIRIMGPDGRQRHIEIHIATLILPPRLRPEIIIVVRNITERAEFENQVFQSEKLATVGRLAAGIAHEINNPMASILTCAEGLLRGHHADADRRKEYLEIIRNSARRCKIITQKLLDYSADATPTKEKVLLNDVLRETVSLLQFEATRKDVTLRVSDVSELPPVFGSKDSLEQVFVNLVLNSIQAVEPGGDIEVVARHNGDTVEVLVNDNGPGISSTQVAKIFEPFFTTKEVGVGTGLGLSVSQGIVKRHGGTLDVVETCPGFTSLRVALPVASTQEKDDHEQT